MKIRISKKIRVAILGIFFLVFLLPSIASAQLLDPSDGIPSCSISPWDFSLADCIAWATHHVLNIIFFITGALVAFAGAIIQLMIDMSKDVLHNPLVNAGFSVSLSVANLGFVFAIIIIAFATILRYEHYELKQMLWKLIVAAVLVNFSFLIAGVIMDFSNVLGYYFIDFATPGGGTTGYGDFASGLADSMQIQNLVTVKSNTGGDISTGIAGLTNVIGASFATIFSLFIAVVFSILILVIFFGIGLMLLIRYLYLTILLILMPLAWLFWIIPDLSHLWSRWWKAFFKWNFFLPAVSFFLFLGIAASQKINAIISTAVSHNTAALAVGSITIQTDGIQTFLQVLVNIGIFAGALIAGNEIGIAGSSAAMSAATSVKDKSLGYAKRKSLQFTTGFLNKKGADTESKSAAERTQAWAANRQTRLGRFGASLVSAGVAGLAATGGTGLVKQREDKVKKMTDLEKQAALLNPLLADEPTRVAILKSLTDSQKLDKVNALSFINEDTKKSFLKYGAGGDFGNMEKTIGMNIKMAKEIHDRAPEEKVKAAAAEFYSSFSSQDFKKLQANDVYSKDPKFGFDKDQMENFQKSISHGIASSMPGMMASIAPKLSGKSFDVYNDKMQDAVLGLEGEKLKRASKAFDNGLGHRLSGGGHEEHGEHGKHDEDHDKQGGGGHAPKPSGGGGHSGGGGGGGGHAPKPSGGGGHGH
jgi:uncharacterized membrane protein YgcG